MRENQIYAIPRAWHAKDGAPKIPFDNFDVMAVVYSCYQGVRR